MSYLKRQHGQGLVEYIILITLMGIMAIAVVQRLGRSTHHGFSNAATRLDSALEN